MINLISNIKLIYIFGINQFSLKNYFNTYYNGKEEDYPVEVRADVEK